MTDATRVIGPELHLYPFQISSLIVLQFMGIVCGIGPVLQTLLLGQLADEGRITLEQIGQTAAAEGLGMLLAASLASALLRPARLRMIVVTAAILAVAANSMTTMLAGQAIMVTRLANGLSSGILLWVFVAALTRMANPARQIAIHITAQAAIVLALGYLFSYYLFPLAGSSSGYYIIAGAAASLCAAVFYIPGSLPPLPMGDKRLPPAVGFAGLTAVGLHLAAILAVWVYAVPLGREAGLSVEATGAAISFALGAQVLAGIIVIMIAAKLKATAMLLGSIAATLCGIAFLAAATPASFAAGIAMIAIFWMIMGPFQMPYLIAIDSSRRTAMQSLTAQLLGVSGGPLLASIALGVGGSLAGALAIGAALLALTAIIISLTHIQREARVEVVFAGAQP